MMILMGMTLKNMKVTNEPLRTSQTEEEYFQIRFWLKVLRSDLSIRVHLLGLVVLYISSNLTD
jgi:hypothetical protein